MAEENAKKKENPDIAIDTALPLEENMEALHAKNDSKSLLILAGIVIGIFVLLFAGFRVYNSLTSASVVSIDDLHQQNLAGELDEDYEGYIYNGYSFVKVDGLWWTEMNKFGTLYKAPLHFAPRELENLIIGGTLDDTFNQGDEVYVTIDPTVQDKYYTLAVSELSFNIVQGMDRTPIGSCTEEDEACDNRTIISCETANGKPTIELGVGPEPEITLQGSCIKIRGTEYGIVKAVDRLLYQWFGIMD